MRVLVVEDEINLAEALKQILIDNKFKVDVVHDGMAALDYATVADYDAIILDVMLPKMMGFDVLKQLRQEKDTTPILMLTAKDEISSKIAGLDLGADDYMTKPFVAEELLARLRAITRRMGDIILDEVEFGSLQLNTSTYDLNFGLKSIRLSFKEAEVLKCLMVSRGTIVPKEDLITRIWGVESDAEDNNVEVYISFLRKKLKYLGADVNIVTVRKVGYKMEKIS